MLIDDGTRGLSGRVIGAAIRVHRRYGPGLLEKAYRVPLVLELEKLGLFVECEVPLPLEHDGVRVVRAYWMDIVVDRQIVIEVKSVQQLTDLHVQQVRTYLRLSGIRVGLLMNFNVAILRHGIRRVMASRADLLRP